MSPEEIIVTNGGSEAVLFAFLSCLNPGDEIIVPANTYIATALAVTYVGAKPVFVEPKLETFNINPKLIESAITSKTKAILPVHLYGRPCEMDLILNIPKE